MKKHYRHETDCLNCGADLQGPFCHKCGQENLEMKESFGHMLNHAISDYFHFDYQFFHTMRPLFTKPGKLTVDYLAGRRMQYLHPVKMYIFISLVFFVLFFKVNGHDVVHFKNGKEHKSGVSSIDTAKGGLLQQIDKDTSLTAAQKAKVKRVAGTYLPAVAGKPAEGEKTDTIAQNGKGTKQKVNKEDIGLNTDGKINIVGDQIGANSYEEYSANQSKLPKEQRNGVLMHYIIKKQFDWKNQGKNAQEIVIESVRHNLPKMMFAILPLFALILKVAFRKNHKLYVEHIIYSIHLHCFIFLFLTALLLLQVVLPHSWEKPVMDVVNMVAFFFVVWYVYRSFRVFYQRSRWRTVSKMIGVSLMYFLTSIACFFVFLLIIALTSV